MTNEKLNVPELRFPGFEDKWNIKKIGDLLEENIILNQGDGNHGNLYPKSTEFSDYGIPYLSASNIKNEELNFDNIKYLPIKRAEEFIKGVAKDGDILLAHNATVGPSVLLKTEFPFVILSTTLTFYRVNKDKMNNYFFLVEFRSGNIQKQLARLMKQTTRNQVPILLQRKIKFSYPEKLKEQQKIGDFFSKLDRQIELEEQKLEKLDQQKKAYIQKIFSHQLRFKDENGNNYPDWEITNLEKIAEITKGFTPSTKNKDFWEEKNKNWLSIAGMHDKNIYEGNKGITEKATKGRSLVKENTLIMSFKLSLGKLAIIRKPIYTNEAICHFNWKNDDINTEYMYEYLNSVNISSFASQAAKGLTLNNESLNSIVIKLPIISEQEKIGGFLSNAEKIIEVQKEKINKLHKRKQAFLQRMFI